VSQTGVRAEDWLAWDHYREDMVANREDAIDKEFVEGLFKGIEEDVVLWRGGDDKKGN
jgi:hypothetical protein